MIFLYKIILFIFSTFLVLFCLFVSFFQENPHLFEDQISFLSCFNYLISLPFPRSSALGNRESTTKNDNGGDLNSNGNSIETAPNKFFDNDEDEMVTSLILSFSPSNSAPPLPPMSQWPPLSLTGPQTFMPGLEQQASTGGSSSSSVQNPQEEPPILGRRIRGRANPRVSPRPKKPERIPVGYQ